MLYSKISFVALFVSFIVGIVYIYLIGPEQKNVTVYPTPENIDETQYKDKTGQCFKYESKKTECSLFPQNIKILPFQI